MPNYSGVVLNQNQRPVVIPPYVDTILGDNPQSWWRTDEVSGTAAADQRGYNAATYVSGVTLNQPGLVPADTSKAVVFDGAAGEMTTAVQQTNPVVLSLSCKFKTISVTGGGLIGFMSSQTGTLPTNYDRSLWMDNSGKIWFGIYTGSFVIVTSSASYNDGLPHTVVATLAANGNLALYVDGALVASSTNTTQPQAYNGYWRIGHVRLGSWPSTTTNEFFNGTIDEPTIYNYALSPDQVLAQYQAAQGPTGPTAIATDGLWRYQEFFLPSDYTRGSDADETIIPALTGSQLLVGVTDATTASIDWTLEYDLFGSGWQTLAAGTALGAQAEGDKIWLDLYFDNPLPITTDLLSQRFRLGFKPNAGISETWVTAPNPFATQFAKAYQADGETVIQALGEDAAFCFRLLGRVADEGIDFLGNRYRSVVIENSGDERSWLSKPNPSRFAVESLYYDVRPQTHDTYEQGWTAINNITNPKAAIDTTGWSIQGSGGETLTNLVGDMYTAWPSGFNSGFIGSPNLHTNVRYHFTAGIAVVPGDVIRFAGWVNSASNVGQIDISIARPGFANIASDIITPPVPQQWYWLEVEYTAVAAETLQIYVHHTTGSDIQFTGMIMTKNDLTVDLTNSANYFDGDIFPSEWLGAANASASRNGPAWIILNSGPSDNTVVIDSVLVDPTTPGVYFNIYYSSEGAPGTTTDEWDDKLWAHVPSTFHALKRESHVLPEPIVAKYIKIEFSHLQARYYSPGDFARPTQYRKHPKWVLDYFLARTTAELATDRLFTGRVGVIYDAISLAYDYYLDDLAREPDQPVEIDQRYTDVQNFLSQRNDASDQIDSETLNKINLALAPYRSHPTTFAKNDYLLGEYAKAAAGHTLSSYPSEVSPSTIDTPDVAELRNEAVVFESDFPVMFFYLTCRHKYREVVAPFSHDRAYFVGINEIAFTRDRYTAATDSTSYREPAGDLLNTERNDFTSVDGVMVIQ